MHADHVLGLGLGVTPPWKLVGQRLDTDKRPNELHIEVAADRGARFSTILIAGDEGLRWHSETE